MTGQDETNYDNINAAVKEFEPLYNLWTKTEIWRKSHYSWLNDDFEKLDSVFLAECVDDSEKTMNKVIRQLKGKELPGIEKIAVIVKEEVEAFKIFVDMAIALRTEGLKDRHWEQISKAVGFEVKPYEGFTFQHILDMNLYKWNDEICEIGERAGKEYNIETSMARMKNDWLQVFLTCKPFRNSGTCTVIGFDEGINFLDEHQTLATLLYVSNVIEEWIKC